MSAAAKLDNSELAAKQAAYLHQSMTKALKFGDMLKHFPNMVEECIEQGTWALLYCRDRGNQHVGGKHYNVILAKPAQQGNSRAYTLDRLSRDAPELYEAVKRKELSPYAAAIEAGFRKRPQPLDQIRKLLHKANRKRPRPWVSGALRG